MRTALSVIFAVLVSAPAIASDLTPNQRLIYACYKLDVEGVVRCLRAGADVNATFGQCAKQDQLFRDRRTGGLSPLGNDSWTALIAVASSAYPDLADHALPALRETGRHDALNERTTTCAIETRERAVTILSILLSHRCKLDAADAFGATALYKAVEGGHVSLARWLLEFGANPNTKTKAYIDGPSDITPLHVACRSKEMVGLLLAHGADVSAKDSSGQTPADWVALDDSRDFDLVVTADGPRVRPRQKVPSAQ